MRVTASKTNEILQSLRYLKLLGGQCRHRGRKGRNGRVRLCRAGGGDALSRQLFGGGRKGDLECAAENGVGDQDRGRVFCGS